MRSTMAGERRGAQGGKGGEMASEFLPRQCRGWEKGRGGGGCGHARGELSGEFDGVALSGGRGGSCQVNLMMRHVMLSPPMPWFALGSAAMQRSNTCRPCRYHYDNDFIIIMIMIMIMSIIMIVIIVIIIIIITTPAAVVVVIIIIVTSGSGRGGGRRRRRRGNSDSNSK